MLFAITIWEPGNAFLFLLFCLCVWVVGIGFAVQFGKKYLGKNPDLNTAAKKAVAKTAINLLARWLK